MEGLINQFSLGYVLITAILIGIVVFYYRVINPMDERTKAADCPNNTRRIRSLEGKVRKAEDKIIRIDERLNPSKTYNMNKKKSPRRLTEAGETVYNEINGGEFLNTHKDFLFEQIDLREPQCAYDVEEYAYMACLTSVNEPFFLPLKSYVYNAPEMMIDGNPHEITMSDVCSVLSTPLRDMYLEAHPELPR